LRSDYRYDAKADLWSVGTVLFEMITGRPPFNGENHIDLLRNIQRKAVRLPPDVKVSKECVTLLRVLLNRNPLQRAGFKEFFEACDAFVGLGCNGVATQDEGTCQRPKMLGTIQEGDNSYTGADSMVTTTTAKGQQPISTRDSPVSAAGYQQQSTLTRASSPRNISLPLHPLVPSPPSSSPIMYNTINAPSAPSLNSNRSGPTISVVQRLNPSNLWRQPQLREVPIRPSTGLQHQNSGEGDSFVMVEHGTGPMPLQRSPTTSTIAIGDSRYLQQPQYRLEGSSPSSPFLGTPVLTTRGDYMIVRQPKGMLSTSPGTGGALMGMLSGHARLGNETIPDNRQTDVCIMAATKLLATAEDVGRRAISVAHLGDQRAYAAMRLVMMSESSSSSLVSVVAMEGIDEEGVDGAITDDSSISTEVMTSYRRRRRSSSATDKSMPDAKSAENDTDDMPFALHVESLPLLSAGMPSREAASFHRGVHIASSRLSTKPTPAVIRSHFNETLACYLKSLKMLKGAISAGQRVASDLDSISGQRLNSTQLERIQKMKKRCDVTTIWLGEQFRGVLSRGDATNVEIGKLQSLPEGGDDNPPSISVDELIFNNSIGFGREGAVKQLLGQFDLARSCYRTAGLLAETLLMETNMGHDDRKVLEGYVDGFAARITELDQVMLQQSRSVAGSSSAMNCSLGSSRRGPAIVSMVAHPFAVPNQMSMDAAGSGL
jgi:hypothetical protein